MFQFLAVTVLRTFGRRDVSDPSPAHKPVEKPKAEKMVKGYVERAACLAVYLHKAHSGDHQTPAFAPNAPDSRDRTPCFLLRLISYENDAARTDL